MKQKIYLVILLSTFLFTTVAASSRTRETRSMYLLKREISYLVEHSNSPGTIKAIEVYSHRHNRILYHSYSHLLLHPASNLKIVTTSFALESLGAGYQFKTRFEASGIQKGDSLEGNLVAIGGGDPILSFNDLDSAAGAVARSGIRYVNGNLVIDVARFDSLQWGNGWMWDDEPASFAMFISPTCLDHNSVTVNISVDPSTNKLAVSTDPATSFVKISCTAVPGMADSLYVNRIMVDDTNTIYVGGTYTPDFPQSTYDFSVRHPAHYFGTVLRELLRKHGITINGKLVVSREVPDPFDLRNLFTFKHSIDTVITYTNKVSDNLGAECFLREVPAADYGEVGSAKNGIDLEKEYLQQCGIDTTQYYIVDGSGVSHYNLITPNAIVEVLVHMLDQPVSKIFFHSLPVAGFDGTLAGRMTDDYVRGLVHAKTGSISGVSTLSGYVIIPEDTLVFSMMMQNFVGSGDSILALEDRICALLTQYRDNSWVFERNLRAHGIGTFGVARREYPRREPTYRPVPGAADRAGIPGKTPTRTEKR